MEIGSAALNILVECWDGHLTPPEVASLADRASRARDSNMVRAAAELALSCLPHAHALNPNEIQRALVQCKEQVSIIWQLLVEAVFILSRMCCCYLWGRLLCYCPALIPVLWISYVSLITLVILLLSIWLVSIVLVILECFVLLPSCSFSFFCFSFYILNNFFCFTAPRTT